MSASRALNVVLCWHMHQPQYCDLISGSYQLPWSYLHATKDYIDMAAHLEAVPGARAVVNFAPVLLDQLSDYAGQVRGFLSEKKPIRDPLLAALACPVLPSGKDERMALVSDCLRVNELHSIKRYPSYQTLADMADWFRGHPTGTLYVGDQFIVDLLVWYHIAWMGETVRRNDDLVRQLMEKGGRERPGRAVDDTVRPPDHAAAAGSRHGQGCHARYFNAGAQQLSGWQGASGLASQGRPGNLQAVLRL
jgi:hypothetical protein